MLQTEEKTDKIIPMIRDFIAYEILTDERYKDYTAFIISKIASFDYDFVLNNMTILNSRHKIRNKESKRAISDIIIKVKNIIINIEVNSFYYKGILEKSHYYYSKLITDSLKINEDYKDIPTIVQINLNNFAVNNNTKKINEYLSMEKDTHDIELSKFRKYHVNMDIIKKECYNNIELTDIEKSLVLFEIDSKRKLKEVTSENSMLERISDRIMELNEDYSHLIREYDCIEKYAEECRAVLNDEAEVHYENMRKEEEKFKEKIKKEDEEFKEKIRKSEEESNEKIKKKAKELKKLTEKIQQAKKELEKYELQIDSKVIK